MKRLRPFPTPEEIRGTDIPEAPWIEPFRGRLTEEHLRCRLAQENRLLRIYEPRFRHPDGHSDRRLIVRLLRTALRGSGLAGRAHRNFQRIEVETREWFLPGLGRGFDGFRILHVSDMHLEFDPGLVGRLRNVVTGLDYDLACLTGDFFDLVFDPDSVDRNLLGDFLSVFRPPIRAVLGNHDFIQKVERLESYTPPWPLPKIFRMTKGGKLISGIFEGATINTVSMLCVEDAVDGLNWAKEIGGLPALIKRSEANLKVIADWAAEREWIDFLAEDPATRSNTSICLKITADWYQALPEEEQAAKAKQLVSLLEKEEVGYDFGSYRDAPAGIRIWGGATVEASDIEALLPWLDWAFEQIK